MVGQISKTARVTLKITKHDSAEIIKDTCRDAQNVIVGIPENRIQSGPDS